jgi:hypothetical protein
VIAPPASPIVCVDTLKAEHDDLHQLWRQHVLRSRCERCADGRWCRVAGDLADRANTAGWRWQEAERRAKQAGQP